MWTCASCNESNEDNFDLCWKCGTSSAGVQNKEFQHVDDIALKDEAPVSLEELSAASPAKEEPPRCFRFGLRKLLILVMLIACSLACWSIYERMSASATLFSAAGRGDTLAIRILLARGYDVEGRDNDSFGWSEWGSTPLFAAISYGQIESARILLSNGANVNAIGLGKTTPLFHARSSEAVRLLLENNADPKHIDERGYTALHYIARLSDDPQAMKEIVLKGTDVNVLSRLGTTPLHEAMIFGNLNIVTGLIDLGADVQARSNDGYSPLHYAAFTPGFFSKMPLMSIGRASRHSADKQESIKLLLTVGAQLDSITNDGFTAQQIAESEIPTNDVVLRYQEDKFYYRFTNEHAAFFSSLQQQQ